PRAIGDYGAPVSLPKLKKAYEKGTRGISWGPLLTPGPRAVPKFPNGQSSPGCNFVIWASSWFDLLQNQSFSSMGCLQHTYNPSELMK
ncbi:unnamed protein product, partial [Staurois parvus]